MLERWLYEATAGYLRRTTTIGFGRYRLLRLARPLGKKLGKSLGLKKIHAYRKFDIELDLADWIPQHIYLTGDFETSTSDIVTKLLRIGDTAVDVGANIGYFSLLFGQCVGPAGKVFAYEPVPALYQKLTHNLALNDFSHVFTSELALSDQSGKAEFHIGPSENTGLSSLRASQKSSGSIPVSLAEFDSLNLDTTRLRLIKIDVEGAELKVIRGMLHTLRIRRPYLIVEITDRFLRDLGDSAEALLSTLTELRYRCFMIGNNGVVEINSYASAVPEQWNALFVPEESLEAVSALCKA
jgi:FkbM family methyltransferase